MAPNGLFFKDGQSTSPISCTTSDLHLSTIGDDLRTTKVGAAALDVPGELPVSVQIVELVELLTVYLSFIIK